MHVDRTKDNALTPMPSWPLGANLATSPVSYEPPNDLVQYGALNFSLWQNFGEEFMIKSTVSNWIACVPDAGSLTRYVKGSLSCRLIRSITSICPELPSAEIWFNYDKCGASVRKVEGYTFYSFEGCLNSHWPIHDPCGNSVLNNLNDRWPEGQIWLR